MAILIYIVYINILTLAPVYCVHVIILFNVSEYKIVKNIFVKINKSMYKLVNVLTCKLCFSFNFSNFKLSFYYNHFLSLLSCYAMPCYANVFTSI